MKSQTRKLVVAALMLAIAVASMFLKNTSVFITGPIVNTCLMLTALFSGIWYGLILAVVTPLFSFLITGSPVMAAVPMIMPMIMIGNAILVFFTWLFACKIRKPDKDIPCIAIGGVVGSVVKAAFMWASISKWLLPAYLPDVMTKKLPILQAQFSTTQLITALIGTALTMIIWPALRKARLTQ